MNKKYNDLKTTVIVFAVIIASYLFGVYVGNTNMNYRQENRLKSVETKLNIYEQSYDNFVAEDNKLQEGTWKN